MQKFVKSLKLGNQVYKQLKFKFADSTIPYFLLKFILATSYPHAREMDSNTSKLSLSVNQHLNLFFFHLPFILVKCCSKGFSASNTVNLKGENLLFLNPTLLFSSFHFHQAYKKLGEREVDGFIRVQIQKQL